MKYLADTNILLRLVQTPSSHHAEAKNATRELLKNDNTLIITLQKKSEFWNHSRDNSNRAAIIRVEGAFQSLCMSSALST